MEIVLDGVSKVINGETHLNSITLQLTSGATNVILGHTLAGKTSLLRLMAGLDRPTKGRIFLDGRDVTGLFVRKRSVAMVYQQFINYPSMTVYDNIASPLKMSGLPSADIDRKVRAAAATLHIDRLLDRMPAELSGGQQQRTAIARSLVKDTELLLLDEPLVNLDYKLREELQAELQDIFRARKAIVVYTTTEPSEALMLGGNLVVMDEGRILQTGPTSSVYHHPSTTRVAQVVSDPPINFLPGVVAGGKARLGRDIDIAMTGHLSAVPDGEYAFGVRPNHLFLHAQGAGNVEISVKVELAEINGSETFIHVSHGDLHLVLQEDGIHPRYIGSNITVYANPGCFFVYEKPGRLLASPFGAG
ncbi:MAG: ABC transporter ATP-binding protein [Smithellaceae bacterium]|nr:ABC transporter ATP-binding protein [Syntrophaceae bacterium]MDD4240237.1 ABC transporter ATP-binding protein [Smithellaceae bacterium]NLX52341.1 ABC transporter ATP-binding protein [Deltaproteobacteria bacterium]